MNRNRKYHNAISRISNKGGYILELFKDAIPCYNVAFKFQELTPLSFFGSIAHKIKKDKKDEKVNYSVPTKLYFAHYFFF